MRMDFNTLMLMYDYHMRMANMYLEAWFDVEDEEYILMNQHKIIAHAIAEKIRKEME